MTIYNVFCRNPLRAITLLKDGDIKAKIAKRTDITYAHTCKLLDHFEQAKLIYFIITGRSIKVYFTPKGVKIRKEILKLIEVLKECE